MNISVNRGMGCMIMLDANSLLEYRVITGDSHCQNQNGKIFFDFRSNNGNLSLLNNKKNGKEK